MFDYLMNGRGGWVTWQSTMPRFAVPMGTPFQAIFVPTVDTVRNSWIIDQLMHNQKHVLCVGDTGTGKSVSLLAKLTKELDKDKYLPVLLSFSAQTTANQTQVGALEAMFCCCCCVQRLAAQCVPCVPPTVCASRLCSFHPRSLLILFSSSSLFLVALCAQDIIDGRLTRLRKGVFGPPLGQRAVIFVDDLNMPAKEKYGAQVRLSPPLVVNVAHGCAGNGGVC